MIIKNISAGILWIFTVISAYAVEVRIKSVEELLREIGPNKTLILEAGEYELSQMAVIPVNNPYIEWKPVYEGKELWINNISNLEIRGEGKAKILTHPRYSFVMNFSGCQNITLDNITAGHTPNGYCTGGVFFFEQCKTVLVSNCILFGSGTVGVQLENTEAFTMKGGVVHNCTYGLGYIRHSVNVSFLEVGFYNTGEFHLFEIDSSQEVLFSKCRFKNNFNGEYLPYFFHVNASPGIAITKCIFTDNKVQEFTNDNSAFHISQTKFKKNVFATPK